MKGMSSLLNPLAGVLASCAPPERKPTTSTSYQKEQWHPKGKTDSHKNCYHHALFRILDFPVDMIKGMYGVEQEHP